jgi:hypothetical protein
MCTLRSIAFGVTSLQNVTVGCLVIHLTEPSLALPLQTGSSHAQRIQSITHSDLESDLYTQGRALIRDRDGEQ